MKSKKNYPMIKKFKDDVDPEMIADLIMELMTLTTRKMLGDKDVKNEKFQEIWKEFYQMTEIRKDDIPF